MLPWQNTWFQLSAFAGVFAVGLLLFDCSHRVPSSSGSSSPGYSSSSSAPAAPQQAPAYNPPAYTPPANPPSPAPANTGYNPGNNPTSNNNNYNPGSSGPGPLIEEPGVFSYQAPPGWEARRGTNMKYLASIGVRKENYTPNITVFIGEIAVPLPQDAEQCVEALRRSPNLVNLQTSNQVQFSTLSGLAGIRVELSATTGGHSVRENLYFIDAGGGKKVMISAACLAEDIATNQPFFDNAARSFRLQ